jgi:hypothetical protein
MLTEAAQVLASAMAHLIARDPRQFTAITDQFKHSFAAEHGYLTRSRDEAERDAAQRTAWRDPDISRGVS